MAADLYTISHQDMSWENHQYRIFVAAARQPVTNGARPSVLYVLDGNAQFPLAVNAVSEQVATPSDSSTHAPTLPLIVGLGYPEALAYPLEARARDYTYAAPGEAFARGGGAATFFRFLHTAVKPYIEKQYHTNPQRQILSGHSFGGLFALYVLLQHPDAFTHYVIGSPSLWWGNAALVTQLQTSHSEKGDTNAPSATIPSVAHSGVQAVKILQGEYEENPHADPKMTPDRLARMAERKSPVTARELNVWLRKQDVNSQFELLAGRNHGGVIPGVISTAVQTALENSGK